MSPTTSTNLFELALNAHAGLRLLLVALLLLLFARSLSGWIAKGPFSGLDRLGGVLLMILADLQLVLGFLLYFIWSPVAAQARGDMGAAMKDGVLRFWAVEHVLMMVVFVVLLHLSQRAVKRVTEDRARHRRRALFLLLALVLLFVGTPWPGGRIDRPLLPTGG